MTREEYEPDYSSNGGRFQNRGNSSSGSYERNQGGYGGRSYGGGGSSSGSGGYGSGSNNYQRNDGGYSHGRNAGLGTKPEPVDFAKLEPVVKNIYKEPEELAGLSSQDVAQFRRDAEMVIQGREVPK